MPQTPLAKIPYPSGSQAPAAAADMMAAFVDMDDNLVLKAIDAADRNSKYGTAPAGTVVVAGESKVVWFKHGAGVNDWTTVFEDTGWVATGFTIAPGWELFTHLEARRVNRAVEVRAQLTRTGAEIKANEFTNPGNIADTAIVTIPSQFWPQHTVVGTFLSGVTSGAMSLGSSGIIYLRDAHPASIIATGDWLQFSLHFFMDKV